MHCRWNGCIINSNNLRRCDAETENRVTERKHWIFSPSDMFKGHNDPGIKE